jgi:hypothetical protein
LDGGKLLLPPVVNEHRILFNGAMEWQLGAHTQAAQQATDRDFVSATENSRQINSRTILSVHKA